MKLTKIAVLLSGAMLSASVLAASDTHYVLEKDVFFGGTTPRYNVDESKPATKTPVRVGDENDTSWMTPQSKPAFADSNATAQNDHLGLPNDLDENANASGTATFGTSVFAKKSGTGSAD